MFGYIIYKLGECSGLNDRIVWRHDYASLDAH